VTERVDRRDFLAAAGASGVALIAGCSSSAVAAHAGAASRHVAGAAARARVAAGSGIPRTLKQAIRGAVIKPGSPGFAAAAHVYNARFDNVLPSIVARPVDTADVAAAVRWAVAKNVPLRARSGGHSYAGYSTFSKGVVLDLRNVSGVTVDTAARTATIGAGAQLIDVYTTLASHGMTIPAGSCPSVGVGGHALGGGMGLAGRAFGLAADHIVGATIVTADGRVRHVDKHGDPDLLWALKGGGGGNFGVVTQLKMRTQRMPSSGSYFFISWPWSAASEVVAAWISSAPHAPDGITSILHLNAAGSAPSVGVSGQYIGSAGALPGLLAPLSGIPGASVSSGQDGYLRLQMIFAGCSSKTFAQCHTVGTHPGGTFPRMSFNAKSDYVDRPFSSAARAALIAATEARIGQPGSGAILFDAYGGAINRVAPGATAFVHRNDLCCIQYLSYNGGAEWLRSSHQRMRPYVSGAAYQNYIDADLTGWQQAYYGANYARLQATRRRIDPHHTFTFPQAIGR
jgi:FAD/FMN-containing dehydrogenase